MQNIFDLFKQIEIKTAPSAEPVSFIIAGLGNPGDKYAATRHNMGFLSLDYIADRLKLRVDRLKFKSLCGDCTFGGRRVLFMKPQTMMNASGEALREAADFYKIPPESILIIHDDVSLEPGHMRVRRKGSDGGHNGIKSVIRELGTQDFPRIKIGVGAPPESGEMINWVLGGLPEQERPAVRHCIEAAYPCAELITAGNTDEAMNRFNGAPPEEKS